MATPTDPMPPSELVVAVLSVLWLGVLIAGLLYWRAWHLRSRRSTAVTSDWHALTRRSQDSQIDALRGWMDDDRDLLKRHAGKTDD